jgi:integrase/recombinase XerD
VAGLVRSDLSGVLPSVAVWGGGWLPKALAPEQVMALLDSCDRDSAIGLRDLAVMTLLARLGLRAGEVAALAIEDFDWRAGEVTVRGKGGRVEQMPLPDDVGEAVTRYLVGGRPRVGCRSLFLRVCAPIVGIGPVGVSSIVMRACERAGLPPCGAHRLRHTAATAMLLSGGTLDEIGQVLRHRSGPATTSIYAKVDHTALRTVAQPWPGGAA